MLTAQSTHTFFGPMNVGVKLNLRHFSFVHTFFSSQKCRHNYKIYAFLSSWAMDDFDGKNGICIKCVLLLNSIVNDSIQSYLKCICQENIFKRRNKICCHEQRNHQTINTRRSVEIKDLKGITDTKRNHLDRDINLKLLLQASYASDTIP